MKTSRIGLGLSAVVLVLLFTGSSSRPQAFHSGGVAECSGCHSMHSPKPNGSFLLIGTDQSSTCLTCHLHPGDTGPSSYHIATADADMGPGVAPKQRTPGGDFGWLRKDYSFTVRGTTTTENGRTHGHNIVAIDVAGYVADADNTTAPGGTFSSAQLGCQSCHDPHGRVRRRSDGTYATGATLGGVAARIVGSGSYGAIPLAGQAVGTYRLLRGLGDNTQTGVTFNDVAVAVANSTYNRTEASTQTRTAYGASGTYTWGNWCASCHPNMHSAGNYVHPTDQALGTDVANVYSAYVKSGDMSGSAASSYNSLVPFMENTGDIATLASHAKIDNSYLNGPSSSDKVSCLSCHRAHASGWKEALRWNMEGEFMVYNSLYPGTDTTPTAPQFAQGRLSGETQAAYYDRPVTQFASYQRVLCNKCHGKD